MTSRLLKFGMQVVFTVAAMLALTASNAFSQSSCFRPLCTDPHEPIYTGADGTNHGVPYGVCQSNTSAPAAMSHTLMPCPAGTTLVPGAGMCHVDGCGGKGGACTWRGVCASYPGFPNYSGDGVGAGGVLTATCNSIPTGLNYRSHVAATCPAGFSLLAGTGICQQCAVKEPPVSRALPDLVIKAAWLRTRVSATHVSVLRTAKPYYACFIVENIGMVPSGVFRVGGGGLGVPTAPYQDHAGLAAGATRSGCLDYPTAPAPGHYNLGLTVDSLSAVTEMREDNNTATIPVTITP